MSKSSGQRLQHALERRKRPPESWVWDTADGRQWLTRLVVATLYTFGRKRGVGLDTLREFFTRRHHPTQVGGSPAALRGVMQALETALLETTAAWEQPGGANGARREVIGAGDETFLERLILVCLDLATGYLLREEAADERTYTTWKAWVEERLQGLGTGGLYVVSARAQALLQLAEHGLACLSMPDVFHVAHEIVQSYSLVLGQRWRHAQQALPPAREALARRQEVRGAQPASRDARALGEMRHAEVPRGAEAPHLSRGHWERLSLTLQPFHLSDSTPQTAAQGESQLLATGEAIEACAQGQQLPPRQDAMRNVRKQGPARAALVAGWWQGVHQDVEPCLLSPKGPPWVPACLRPMVYWATQGSRTRGRRRQAKLQEAWEAMRLAFAQPPITQRLAPHILAAGQGGATDRVKTFQRASSAVEGRHGLLAPLHHHQRGLPKQRYKVWTVLHNFDGRAAEGTTPAARFFRRTLPDLFETV